uniref:Uncharacterized protein n=1 Tax=Panthera leo TaxID=9689 RepID=A0A8C8WJR6_PANLE
IKPSATFSSLRCVQQHVLCMENAADSKHTGKGRRVWGQMTRTGAADNLVGVNVEWQEGVAGCLSRRGGDFAALSAELVSTKWPLVKSPQDRKTPTSHKYPRMRPRQPSCTNVLNSLDFHSGFLLTSYGI